MTGDAEGSVSRERTKVAAMAMGDNFAKDPARDDLLILVDGLDRERGKATKVRAHEEGLLHRAFSVVLMREMSEDGWSSEREDAGERRGGPEILLSQRAFSKYHSGGLWANSCCSHPRAGEELLDAARNRIREELGCEAVGLREIGAFVYRAEFENGLIEHEYDHVLLGRFEGVLDLDPTEVDDVRWVDLEELARELADAPEVFTAWAPMVLSIVLKEVTR